MPKVLLNLPNFEHDTNYNALYFCGPHHLCLIKIQIKNETAILLLCKIYYNKKNSVVHLRAEQRRDGENDKPTYQTKTWATHLQVIIRVMNELRFLHKNKVPKVS